MIVWLYILDLCVLMYIWREMEKEMYKIGPKQMTGLLSNLFLKRT